MINNVYFLKLKPPNNLLLALSQHSINILSALPNAPDSEGVLVLFKVTALKQLTEIPFVRSQLPLASIVLIVPDAWINAPDKLSAITLIPQIEDMRYQSGWQSQFLFSLTKSLERFKTLQTIKDLLFEKQKLEEELAMLNARAAQIIHQVESQLKLAENIQRSIIPIASPAIPGIRLNVKYLPAAGNGGDYFDIFEFGDKKRFGFILADSESHAMAATLLGILIKIRVDEVKERFAQSDIFVDFINGEMANHNQKSGQNPSESLHFLYGIFDRDYLTFDVTVAGKLSIILVPRDGKVGPHVIEPNPSLGRAENTRYKRTHIQLRPGDSFLLHTNGLGAFIDSHDLSQLLSNLQNNQIPDGLAIQNEILTRIKITKRIMPDDITLIHVGVVENALYLASHSK